MKTGGALSWEKETRVVFASTTRDTTNVPFSGRTSIFVEGLTSKLNKMSSEHTLQCSPCF